MVQFCLGVQELFVITRHQGWAGLQQLVNPVDNNRMQITEWRISIIHISEKGEILYPLQTTHSTLHSLVVLCFSSVFYYRNIELQRIPLLNAGGYYPINSQLFFRKLKIFSFSLVSVRYF